MQAATRLLRALGPSLPTVGAARYVLQQPSKSGRAKDLLFRAVPRVLSAAPRFLRSHAPASGVTRSPGKNLGFYLGRC